jgi:hypothetical protein
MSTTSGLAYLDVALPRCSNVWSAFLMMIALSYGCSMAVSPPAQRPVERVLDENLFRGKAAAATICTGKAERCRRVLNIAAFSFDPSSPTRQVCRIETFSLFPCIIVK